MELLFDRTEQGNQPKVRDDSRSPNPKSRRAPAHARQSPHPQKIPGGPNINLFLWKLAWSLPLQQSTNAETQIPNLSFKTIPLPPQYTVIHSSDHSTSDILYIVFFTLYPVRYRYNTVLYIHCSLYIIQSGFIFEVWRITHPTLLPHSIIRSTQIDTLTNRTHGLSIKTIQQIAIVINPPHPRGSEGERETEGKRKDSWKDDIFSTPKMK